MANQTLIYDIYKSKASPDTNVRVADRINHYIQKDIAAISDGIISAVPKIAAQTRDFIAAPYNITNAEWSQISKSKEWYNMKKTASILKVGLIISYSQTKNPLYLNFMMILIYSSLMQKYFPNGYDKQIMKYTLDVTADNRTDFKNGSLITVVNKKVDTFRQIFDRKLTGQLSDKTIREALQSLTTRMNETVKALSSKYYKNFKDPDVKVMMEYSKTDDGKNQLNPLSVMEVIREKAVNNLQTPSDLVLKMMHMGPNDIKNLKYRRLFIEFVPECFGLLSMATNELLNEWIKRNTGNLTLSNFRTTFVKTMTKARNISHIMKYLDEMATRMIAKFPTRKERREYPFIELRDYCYHYIILNIYIASSSVM